MIQQFVEDTQKDWNYITPTAFYEDYLKKGRSYYLLDVREPKAFAQGHIKGAKNIFWLDLFDEKNLRKLPKNKKIFVICYVGHTASQVMSLLKLLGYDVTAIKFGYGISPVFGVPVAGWSNYNYPMVRS
jgi:rhodanese-related sulfurtransferase